MLQLSPRTVERDWEAARAWLFKGAVRGSKQLDGILQDRLLAADQNPPDWGSGNLANSVSLQGTDFTFTVDVLKEIRDFAGGLRK